MTHTHTRTYTRETRNVAERTSRCRTEQTCECDVHTRERKQCQCGAGAAAAAAAIRAVCVYENLDAIVDPGDVVVGEERSEKRRKKEYEIKAPTRTCSVVQCAV